MGDRPLVGTSDGVPHTRIRLGFTYVTEIESAETRITTNAEADYASIVVRRELLADDDIHFYGEAAIEAEVDGHTYPLFAGLVESVRLDGELAHIELSGLARDLETSLIGGLVIHETPPKEMMYSFLRQAGIPAERINIHGWTPGPPEHFLVVARLDGVRLTDPVHFHDVVLTPHCPVIGRLQPEPQVQMFEREGVWIYTTVKASLLLDAERLGLERLRLGVAILRCLAAYGHPLLAGVSVPFSWAVTRARPALSSVVFTGALSSPRCWLQETRDVPVVPDLNLQELLATRPEGLPDSTPPGRMFERAFREWHAAADAQDEFTAIGHLSRAIECYADGVAAPHLFSDEQIKNLRQQSLDLEEWSADQRDRIRQLVGRLNDAPLLARVRVAAERDGVPMTTNELGLLSKVRGLRNDVEHGRPLTAAQHRQLTIATGVVCKLLLAAALNWNALQRPARLDHQ